MYLPETEPKHKEQHFTKAELKERYRKRLASLPIKERRILQMKRFFGHAWPIFRACVIVGLCFIILYPLIFMLSTAFRPNAQMTDPTVMWISRSFTLDNIKQSMTAMSYWPTFKNTVFLNGLCAILQVFSCALTGYGFARFKFKGQKLLFFFVILQILVPAQILTIPQFKFFRYFPFGVGATNLIDKPITMYLPALTSNGIRAGLFIFLFRQAFKGLPKELEDAAYLDGCSPFRTFVQVMVPNASSIFLTVFLFSIVWYWNDFYVSTTFFTDYSTMALMLKNLDANLTKIIFGNNASLIPPRQLIVWLEAGCLVAITPILILYALLQKYFTEGIARSGLTGM
jgi:multiple sugar transport system permease protein